MLQAVKDAATDQNFRALEKQIAELPFLQLVSSLLGAKVAFGEAEIEFAGEKFESKVTTVTHGLGTTPAVVLATSVGEGYTAMGITEKGATTFKASGVISTGKVAGGTKVKFYWGAIG